MTVLPKEVDLAAVSPILCAGITVYKGLKESGARPRQTVAIVGAGGGLGSLAQQYARLMGLRTIAIDSGDEKRAMCQKLGSEVCTDVFHEGCRDINAETRPISTSRSRRILQPR